jgi:hypothetical protein
MVGIFATGILVGERMNSFEGNRGLAKAGDVPAVQEPKAAEVQRSADSRDVRFAVPAAQSPGLAAGSGTGQGIQKIDELRDSAAEKSLTAALGDDSIGLKVSRALLAGRHSEVAGASEIAREFHEELRSDPRTGVQVIRESLGRIPPKGFEVDRITLLQTMSALPGVQTDVQELALQELISNVYEVPTGEAGTVSANDVNRASLVVTAHRLFVEAADQSEVALSGTVQGVLAQPDSAVRRTMIDRFVARFPEHKEDIQRELGNNRIDVNVLYGAQGNSNTVPVVVTEGVPAGSEAPVAEQGATPTPENASPVSPEEGDRSGAEVAQVSAAPSGP